MKNPLNRILFVLLAALMPSAAMLAQAPASQNAAQQAQTRRCLPITQIAPDRWRGEYFNNADFSGNPVMVRDDGAADLDFQWGLGSPERQCGVPSDNFAVRWTRTIAVTADVYRFSVTGDDGFRLLVDGQQVLDEWHPQLDVTRSAELQLAAGKHTVVLEYFERFGSATLKFAWANAPCQVKVAADRWKAEYFDNATLSGKPAYVTDEGNEFVKHDWQLATPNENCLKVKDNFSARWTRSLTFQQGVYRFKFAADDGVRLYVDKQLKLDQWRDQRTTYAVDLELASGIHTIVVEYFEHYGSAWLEFNWERHPCLATVAPDHWRGEYFATADFSGNAAVIRDEGQGQLELKFPRNFNGQNNSYCLLRENFTARFTRKVTFGNGTYKFTLASRERVRLLLDGEKLLDQASASSGNPATIEATVTAGNHVLTVEYGKDGGEGALGLEWEPVVRALPVKRK